MSGPLLWYANAVLLLLRGCDVLLMSYCSSSHLAFLCHCSVSLWYAIAVCQCCMPMLSYYGMPLLKPNTPPMPMLYPVLGVASKQVNDRFSASADPNCVLSSIYINTSHCCAVLFCTSLVSYGITLCFSGPLLWYVNDVLLLLRGCATTVYY